MTLSLPTTFVRWKLSHLQLAGCLATFGSTGFCWLVLACTAFCFFTLVGLFSPGYVEKGSPCKLCTVRGVTLRLNFETVLFYSRATPNREKDKE